jgi:hypothetical protein
VPVPFVTSLNIKVAHDRAPYNLSRNYLNNASKGTVQKLGRGYQKPTPANPRQNSRKSTRRDIGSTRKKACKETLATSFDLVLTNISSTNKVAEAVIDYQKVAKAQKNFLLHCQDC